MSSLHTKKPKQNHRKFTHRVCKVLDRVSSEDIISDFNTGLCTRCGNPDFVSKGQSVFYKGIQVHIALCRKCVPVVVKGFLDQLIKGHILENEIDKLTKYNQT